VYESRDSMSVAHLRPTNRESGVVVPVVAPRPPNCSARSPQTHHSFNTLPFSVYVVFCLKSLLQPATSLLILNIFSNSWLCAHLARNNPSSPKPTKISRLLIPSPSTASSERTPSAQSRPTWRKTSYTTNPATHIAMFKPHATAACG
jgi:hypothetical protein